MQPRPFGKLFAPCFLALTLIAACSGGGGSEAPGGGDGGGDEGGEDEAPVAGLNAAPTSGKAPLQVAFTDTSVGVIDVWQWSFGDGSSSSAQNPSHTYTTPGTYTVSLTVSGPGGSSTATLPDGIGVSAGIDCEAGDASDNTPFPLLSQTYDFVPVTGDGRGFWCVYSVRNGPNGEPMVGNNVGIFLFEIDPLRVLMFGAGYGDILYNGQGPLFDAAFDMGLVDAVIQGCMGRDPRATTVIFVTPHGHGDHVNAAAIRELRNLNYAVSDIYYHGGDEGAVTSLEDWTSQDFAIFRRLDGNACFDTLLAMNADLGWLWFLSRPGHTAGSIDLVVDVDGNTNDRIVVYGSAANSTCGDPTGTRFAVNAHGNVLIP